MALHGRNKPASRGNEPATRALTTFAANARKLKDERKARSISQKLYGAKQ